MVQLALNVIIKPLLASPISVSGRFGAILVAFLIQYLWKRVLSFVIFVARMVQDFLEWLHSYASVNV